MLIRKLIVLSLAMGVMIGAMAGCKPPEPTAPSKPAGNNTTQGKK